MFCPSKVEPGARSKYLVTVVTLNDSQVWPMICRWKTLWIDMISCNGGAALWFANCCQYPVSPLLSAFYSPCTDARVLICKFILLHYLTAFSLYHFVIFWLLAHSIAVVIFKPWRKQYTAVGADSHHGNRSRLSRAAMLKPKLNRILLKFDEWSDHCHRQIDVESVWKWAKSWQVLQVSVIKCKLMPVKPVDCLPWNAKNTLRDRSFTSSESRRALHRLVTDQAIWD